VQRLVLAPVVVLAACFSVAAVSAQPPIGAKRAQAAAVLAQVNAIDVRLGHTVDAFDGARERLTATERSIAANRVALRLSSRNLRRAQARLSARLVALYVSDEPATMDVLLGATSLQDVIDRLNAAGDVSAQDRQIADAAERLQRQLDGRRRALARERARRAATVGQLSARRAEIQRSLARRQQLLASIRTQIAQLRAQERAREQLLAARARARITRELAARRAAELAAARKNVAPAQPPSTPQQPPAAPSPSPPTTAPSPPPPPPEPPSIVPSGGHPEAAAIAARYLGVPYRWGGASPAGFDCSGLVLYVYAQLGIALPHFTVAQYALGVAVPRDELQPGDLVFFDGLGHVGIYIGGGQFIHAPHTGDVVRVSSLSDSWYAATYVGARRI
jgi:cell wall-associated NlpC family hydrolase